MQRLLLTSLGACGPTFPPEEQLGHRHPLHGHRESFPLITAQGPAALDAGPVLWLMSRRNLIANYHFHGPPVNLQSSVPTSGPPSDPLVQVLISLFGLTFSSLGHLCRWKKKQTPRNERLQAPPSVGVGSGSAGRRARRRLSRAAAPPLTAGFAGENLKATFHSRGL